ncbi:MAG: hypothetical protein DHS20C18_30250 [Saprospiraceae bacterium]|nr:MAG: hypothetical protein DHS20C18_30250 [Saprospiraceae bacterium]
MKFFLIAVLSSFLMLSADTTKVEWLTEETHDFGDILHHQMVSYQFEFKNTSGVPLVIDNVRTSCGCTVADWGVDPILPDSTGQIGIEYDARDLGYFRKWIKVYFSGQRKAEKRYIEGFVVE